MRPQPNGYHFADLTAEQIDRLSEKLASASARPSGCTEIDGHGLHSGHVQIQVGTLRSKGRGIRQRSLQPFARVRAHVFAWELANAQSVPSGRVVMHACDNPRCVNPNHLTLGTQADNIADSIRKGRFTLWHVTQRRLSGAVPKPFQEAIQSLNAEPQYSFRPFDHPDVTFERVPQVELTVRGVLELAPPRQSHSR